MYMSLSFISRGLLPLLANTSSNMGLKKLQPIQVRKIRAERHLEIIIEEQSLAS